MKVPFGITVLFWPLILSPRFRAAMKARKGPAKFPAIPFPFILWLWSPFALGWALTRFDKWLDKMLPGLPKSPRDLKQMKADLGKASVQYVLLVQALDSLYASRRRG